MYSMTPTASISTVASAAADAGKRSNNSDPGQVDELADPVELETWPLGSCRPLPAYPTHASIHRSSYSASANRQTGSAVFLTPTPVVETLPAPYPGVGCFAYSKAHSTASMLFRGVQKLELVSQPLLSDAFEPCSQLAGETDGIHAGATLAGAHAGQPASHLDGATARVIKVAAGLSHMMTCFRKFD